MSKAEKYAKKRDGKCIGKTGQINDFDVYLWSCENRLHQWEAPYKTQKLNIARRYTKKWRDVVDVLDKNLQGREFIVIDLTRAKEDPLYIRKGWDQPIDLST
ncbi:18759_t:CDS:2 [Entrophospora sp. SA101]|nr:18759_t:CDS:2 [Entrophospora sp. SA101]